MNKNAIKMYAIWARNELINRVTQKAYEYGVSKDNTIDANATSINGKLLTNDEKKQRQQLISDINYKGFDQVIEEVAYTWFNRFIALRYMEVNNYLPNRIRIFTNDNNEFKPQILDEAMNIDLERLDKELVFELLDKNKKEELYKQLIIATCNDMGNYLPGMFTKIADYKVLLFPDNILRQENVVGKLITDIDEDSWLDQVQIIGWMYQYYISEKHDMLSDIVKRNVVTKDNIPAVTQLFTPDWIVRYMVDNSLGKYWIERNPDSNLKSYLKFYIGDEEIVKNDRKEIEKITFLDPCMGSGHILVYAFDIFMEIYLECGYSQREAAIKIIENNIYGLDVDERAYQLSYFALMMKVRKYNRKALTLDLQPNVFAIEESNEIRKGIWNDVMDDNYLTSISEYLIRFYKDAKEIGSLLSPKKYNYEKYIEGINSLFDDKENNLYYYEWVENGLPKFEKLAKVSMILSNEYDICCTNPPYMNKYDSYLKEFLSRNYKDYNGDLFSVFMIRNFKYTAENGYIGFMTPNVWMFIQKYEKLRKYILEKKGIDSLIQLAKGSFFEIATVDVCAFVMKNYHARGKGVFIRLEDFKGDLSIQEKSLKNILQTKDDRFIFRNDSNDFSKIPEMPISYWASKEEYDSFVNLKPISTYSEVVSGMTTGDNNKYLKLWPEVDINTVTFNETSINNVDLKKSYWFPYNKGGSYRKWYGNNNYLVNWSKSGEFNRAKTTMTYLYLKKCLTWSDVTSGTFACRACGYGFFFDVSGSCAFPKDKEYYPLLALLNSKLAFSFTKILNSTIHTQIGDIQRIPFSEKLYNQELIDLTVDCVDIGKKEWDSYEFSWNFLIHPLVNNKCSDLVEAYECWKNTTSTWFSRMKSNEEKINRIIYNIYGVNAFSNNIEDNLVSVRKSDKTRDVKSLLSYAIGCMFGRYSLDVEGLVYAGGNWDSTKYTKFIPDADNIIPICDDEYFTDDIVGRFVEFVKVIYGEDTLEENLMFIANALGSKGTPREVLRNYFLNDFFKDHCNTYQVTGSGKRPIYWLFDSGKKNGFKALIYIHRYTPDLIARMRTQYIHEQQSRYRNQIEMLEKQVESDISTSERVRLTKQLKKFKEQDEELRVYEEKIHHWADKMEPMDLDDGVKANYAKFQELLAKIK